MSVRALFGGIVGLVLASSVSRDLAADPVTWVERGSTWRYFRGQSEASSPDPTAWRAVAFNDASWSPSRAPFGYGETPLGTDLAALVPPMEDNYSTLFLRQTFEVANPAAVVTLEASVDYDDGFRVWINGVEVASDNAPEPPAFNALALSGHERGNYDAFDLPDPDGYIVAGTNVVAVQVFNTSIGSSDLYFDLDLIDPIGVDGSPPVARSIVPAAGSRVRSLTQIEVTFDEAVTGVDPADLEVNGDAATGVSGAAAGPYRFTFAPPPAGSVTARWRAEHGIADLAGNSFTGGDWSYELDPNAPLGNVVINEILASNRAGLRDADGDASDWVELTNLGAVAVDIGGWSLSDDPNDSGKFVLPSRSIAPNAFLLVFASAKDRAPASGEVHLNFKLDTAPEPLALWTNESPRQVASALSPSYPAQRTDIAYGRTGTGAYTYLLTPTPRAANSASQSVAGIVADPVFSHERGYYTPAFDLRLMSPTSAAEIFYTIDGSEPTRTNGTRYTAPIRVDGTAARAARFVRAAAFRDGFLPSRAVTGTYLFPRHVVRQPNAPAGFPSVWPGTTADYEMDPTVIDRADNEELALDALATLPAISIVGDPDGLFGAANGNVTHPSGSGDPWEREVSAEMFLPQGGDGFWIQCGFRVQGGSSTGGWKSKKTSFRLAFRGDYGFSKLAYRFFPDSPVESFDSIVLDAHLNLAFTHPDHGQRVRSQYIRDMYVSDLQLAMGSLAPHSRLCSLYINGLFWGVYDVHERPDNAYCEEYLGGDKEEWDILRHSGSTIVDGNGAAWNTMVGRVRAGLSSNANYLAAAEYLDVLDFADYMLVNLWAGNTDWPHHNWYAGRRRVDGGQFRFFSWDAEHVLKSVSDNRVNDSDANSPGEIFDRLRDNAEFRLLFADRANLAFASGGPLHVDAASPDWNPARPDRNIAAKLYMRRVAEIDHAMVLESARWGDVRREPPYTREETFLDELDWLLTQYFPARTGVVLGQLRTNDLYPSVAAPLFDRRSGPVDAGSSLTISRPAGQAGTIWLTTNGDDPRQFGSGDVAATALEYSSALAISSGLLVKARIRNGTTWSALSEVLLTVPGQYRDLRVSELMYHAPSGNAFDFIELENRGATAIHLGELAFVDGIEFRFPQGFALAPGAFAVIVDDAAAFASSHPAVPIAGEYAGDLDNGGETLTLVDPLDSVVLTLRFGDAVSWPVAADGLGYSLVLDDPIANPSYASAWRVSSRYFGSPGAVDPPPAVASVVVHEVLARTAPPFEDAIELFNAGTAAVDIGGWFLSDDRSSAATLRKFRIADGTMIAPGGFLVVYENQFNATPGSPSSFALDGAGDQVFLSSADPATTDLTGYVSGIAFDALDDAVSFGRHETSIGPDWAPQSARTFGVDAPANVAAFRGGRGAANAYPQVGPVVIHEVMYDPLPLDAEFIELFNLTTLPVALHDAGLGRGWQLRGVRDLTDTDSFELPPGATIGGNGFALVVAIDPEVFRVRFGLPAAVPIFGPFRGGLANSGERLSLMRPAPAESGEQPWVLIDKVEFDDEAPWPAGTGGTGAALERRIAADYGNDPENWGASLRTNGTPGAGNSIGPQPPNQPPSASFTATPASGTAPLAVIVDASASSDPDGTIVRYSWNFGDGGVGLGRVIGHTFQDDGEFTIRLTITDDGGATASTSSVLTVGDAAPNQPPVASFTATPSRGAPPLRVDVDASASRDPDGSVVRYEWDWGDGTSGLGRVLSHTFGAAGAYTITLVVRDDRGGFAFATASIAVEDESGGLQRPGDCNQDGRIDLSDAVCLLGHLFLGNPAVLPCGNGSLRDPANLALLDSNGDGGGDLADAVHILAFLFQGNSPPALGRECVRILGCSDRCTP